MFFKSYLLLEIHITETKCESDRTYKHNTPRKAEKGFLIYKCKIKIQKFITPLKTDEELIALP